MKQAIEIRSETPADASQVREVLLAAFPAQLEADLVELLRANGNLLVSLVAEDAGMIVGHIAFSPVATEGGQLGGAGLAPVAVSPDHQHQGIGRRLIEVGLERCRKVGLPYAVVLGQPTYYQRFGFHSASRFSLTDEYGGGDAFMAMELQPDALSGVEGLVKYGAEFSAFS